MLLDRARRGRARSRVVDPRRDDPRVGVVERRRERVQVGGDDACAGFAEGARDVDPLAGAGEENSLRRPHQASAFQPPVCPL